MSLVTMTSYRRQDRNNVQYPRVQWNTASDASGPKLSLTLTFERDRRESAQRPGRPDVLVQVIRPSGALVCADAVVRARPMQYFFALSNVRPNNMVLL